MIPMYHKPPRVGSPNSKGNGEHPVKEIQGFKVSRRALLETPCNDYWKTLLEGSYKKAGQNKVTLHDDTVASMEL